MLFHQCKTREREGKPHSSQLTSFPLCQGPTGQTSQACGSSQQPSAAPDGQGLPQAVPAAVQGKGEGKRNSQVNRSQVTARASLHGISLDVSSNSSRNTTDLRGGFDTEGWQAEPAGQHRGAGVLSMVSINNVEENMINFECLKAPFTRCHCDLILGNSVWHKGVGIWADAFGKSHAACGCLVVLLLWLREMLLLCAHSWAVDLTGCCLHTAGRWSQLLFVFPAARWLWWGPEPW